MRLDRALVERGLATSRTRAEALIDEGGVSVNGVVVNEKDFPVKPKDKLVMVREELRWVSRAGIKLAHAMERWHIDVKGKVALDIGASTGGFTDVLLSHGVGKVFALDVGHGQLAPKILNDKRVINMEGVHIKDVTKKDFDEKIDIIVIDVSFISLDKVLPKAKELLKKNGVIIMLIKPQFEVGKENIGKGVVTDPKLHANVAMKIENLTMELGFEVLGVLASPILGGDGNKEFLLYATLPRVSAK